MTSLAAPCGSGTRQVVQAAAQRALGGLRWSRGRSQRDGSAVEAGEGSDRGPPDSSLRTLPPSCEQREWEEWLKCGCAAREATG